MGFKGLKIPVSVVRFRPWAPRRDAQERAAARSCGDGPTLAFCGRDVHVRPQGGLSCARLAPARSSPPGFPRARAMTPFISFRRTPTRDRPKPVALGRFLLLLARLRPHLTRAPVSI